MYPHVAVRQGLRFPSVSALGYSVRVITRPRTRAYAPKMLHEFITENRNEILKRARARVALRIAPAATSEELEIGIPLFLDELVETLRGGSDRSDQMDRDATDHGERRHQMGFTLAQVVDDYGDLCQVVTQLAMELRAPIHTNEFKTLNRCLDDGIARAVTEYARARDRAISDEEIHRRGSFAHQLRSHLQTASISFAILKSGAVGVGGSTGALLDQSLAGLRDLVERSLDEVRLDGGVAQLEHVNVSPMLAELERAGRTSAKNRGVSLACGTSDAEIAVRADKQLLVSAVSNLLQNAIKFTLVPGRVVVRVAAYDERVRIEVEDECGGLQPGHLDGIHAGLARDAKNGNGLGLGLLISKRAVESMDGSLGVRDRAGIGCVFTIDLPRSNGA